MIGVSLPCLCGVGRRATFYDSRTCLKTIADGWASLKSHDRIKKALIAHGGVNSFRLAENSRTDGNKPIWVDSSFLVCEKTTARLFTVIGFSPPVPYRLGK